MAQSTTPPSQAGDFLIEGGVVVTPAGRLEGGHVLVRNGRIASVGVGSIAADGATRVDATGRWVFPGLLDSQTSIGLQEMMPESDDRAELGRITPHLRTLPSVNAHTHAVTLARSNGVTAAITQPSGGLMPGPASLLQMDGWTWEEMGLEPVAAMVVNYPRVGDRRGGAEDFGSQVRELGDYIRAARAYVENPPARVDLGYEAMRPVLSREVPLLVRAHEEEEIRSALSLLVDELNLRVIVAGGREAWKVAPLLVERAVPVILGSMRMMPRMDEPYDAVFAQPALLHEAGVVFAFSSESTSASRNLPYHAGTATAYGLAPGVALDALTIVPARIWGVDAHLGSIEVGKRGDLVITDGDILDVRTRVLDVFVGGRRASPHDQHRRLYDKFSVR